MIGGRFGDVFHPVVISKLVCARIMGGVNQKARYSIPFHLAGLFSIMILLAVDTW